MKVMDTNLVKQSIGPKPSGKTGPDNGNAFQKVLHDTIQKTGGTELKPSARPVPATVPIHPAQLNNLLATKTDLAVERIDRFIDMLERYQQKLTEPGATLKDMDRLISDISLEKDRLASLTASLDAEDGLRGILNEALVTASREVFKFQRGDYISD